MPEEGMKLLKPAFCATFRGMEKQACDLLVTASRMLTGTEQPGIGGNAGVAVRDGKILEAGPAEKLEAAWMPSVRCDLGNALLMPGLVNAHTHVPMTFLRGFADDLPLMEWLTKHIFPVEAHLFRPRPMTAGMVRKPCTASRPSALEDAAGCSWR
mgnify:CR=1 FL=1